MASDIHDLGRKVRTDRIDSAQDLDRHMVDVDQPSVIVFGSQVRSSDLEFTSQPGVGLGDLAGIVTQAKALVGPIDRTFDLPLTAKEEGAPNRKCMPGTSGHKDHKKQLNRYSLAS